MLSCRSSITYFSSRMRQATAIDYYHLICFSINNSEPQHASSSAGNMLETAKICFPPICDISPHLRPNLNTAIRMQALARNKATIHARQENKAGRNLTRLSRPSHRRSELLLRLLIHRRRNERRPNRPGTHCINSDPFLNLLVRERSSESYDGAFG